MTRVRRRLHAGRGGVQACGGGRDTAGGSGLVTTACMGDDACERLMQAARWQAATAAVPPGTRNATVSMSECRPRMRARVSGSDSSRLLHRLELGRTCGRSGGRGGRHNAGRGALDQQALAAALRMCRRWASSSSEHSWRPAAHHGYCIRLHGQQGHHRHHVKRRDHRREKNRKHAGAPAWGVTAPGARRRGWSVGKRQRQGQAALASSASQRLIQLTT